MHIRFLNFKQRPKITLTMALRRLSKLLDDAFVKYRVDHDSITSTSVPFAVLSIDPRMYTRKNWLGINPFIFISGIKIIGTRESDNETVLEIIIDRGRTISIYCLLITNIGIVSCFLPALWAGIAFFFAFNIICFLCMFPLIARLIKSEIVDATSRSKL